MDIDVSPQASIQVKTCNNHPHNERHSKNQSSSTFQLGTSILSATPICDDSPIDDCVSQIGACVLSPYNFHESPINNGDEWCRNTETNVDNSMLLEVSPLMVITLSPLRNEDLFSSSRELSGSSLPPLNSVLFIDPLDKDNKPTTIMDATSQSMEGSVIKLIRDKERSSTPF